jgi:hypothetical protein
MVRKWYFRANLIEEIEESVTKYPLERLFT